MSNPKTVNFSLPIEWEFPESIISRYATNLLVQRTEHEYVVSFFETQPPLVLGGTEDEQQKQMEKVTSVKAVCVARIVIAAERMQEFVAVFQTSMQQELSTEEKPETENE